MDDVQSWLIWEGSFGICLSGYGVVVCINRTAPPKFGGVPQNGHNFVNVVVSIQIWIDR